MLSIGLMSGTSMDGIDAALMETDGTPQLIKNGGHTSISYTPELKILLKSAEYAIRHTAGNMQEASRYYPEALDAYLTTELQLPKDQLLTKTLELSAYLRGNKQYHQPITLQEIIQHSTDLHAAAVKKLLQETGYHAQQIDVVGYHGQTMLHRPAQKITIAVGDGQYLANELGITVINDFRSRDVEAGGQGAPFAPIYHQALAIRDNKMPVAVVNCGGIANITLIPNGNELDLIAYDTGPGNGLIDKLVRQRTNGKENMDKDGQYGRQGKVNTLVLQALYDKAIQVNGQNYFTLPPPKALDIGDLTLIPELASLSLTDACATLEAFTADTIITSLNHFNIPIPPLWILAGGGWHNPMIRQELTTRLKQNSSTTQILIADEAGWHSQSLEAQIFAYLAVRSLQNKPLSYPGTTKVPTPMSGGKLYKPAKQ